MAVSFLPKNYVEGNGLLTGIQNLLDMKVKERQMKQLGLPKNMAGMDPRIITQLLQNKQKESQNQIVQDFLNAQYGQPQQSGFQQLVGESGELSQPEQIVEAPQQFQQQPQQQGPSEMQAIMALPSDIRRDLLKEREYERRDIRERRKESKAEQREIDKETLPVYKEVLRKYKDAKENDQRIGRMEELVKKGNLGSATFNNILETISKGIWGFGINLKNLQTADAQEFDKLSTEFLKGAKELFGARVTDNEIKMFMKMVPSLAQSDAGKMRVIANMKIGNEANKIRRDAMREAIKKNNGKRPQDLEDRIEEIAGVKLDKLAEKFKKNMRPMESSPESESFIGRAQKKLGTDTIGGSKLSLGLFGL